MKAKLPAQSAQIAAMAVGQTYPWVKPEDVPEAFDLLQRQRRNDQATGQPPVNRLLTIDETAEVLACSERTVRNMLADGRLPRRAIGRAVRIPASAVNAIIDGRVAS